MQAGIIRVPLAPIRSAPDDRAEMVTQALFGSSLRWQTVSEEEGWAKVVLDGDGYIGYTDVKLIASAPAALDVFGEKLYTLVAPLSLWEWEGRPYHLPAGSQVPAALMSSAPNRPQSPVEAAFSFLGAPYLWGGKSVLGMDCSGLTQLACSLSGVQIPRDASQQWSSLQDSATDYANLQHGDLVFFHRQDPTKVTHVGFSWMQTDGQRQVLHASGEVRIDELKPDGIYRDGVCTHPWTGAARCPVSAG